MRSVSSIRATTGPRAEGTLVFTGDVGHGRHLQEVFEFIHRLASQAHRLGGRIVWTLGNHDLYVDREGGQGGEDSLGYRLWPKIREAALHPERHPGLVVQAAYFAPRQAVRPWRHPSEHRRHREARTGRARSGGDRLPT